MENTLYGSQMKWIKNLIIFILICFSMMKMPLAFDIPSTISPSSLKPYSFDEQVEK